MVPATNRPAWSVVPSLNRLPGLSASGSTIGIENAAVGEEVKAVLQRHDEPALLAQGEAADPARQADAGVVPRRRVEPMQGAPLDVGPPQHLLALAPQGRLAELGLRIEHAIDLNHVPSPSRAAVPAARYAARPPAARHSVHVASAAAR